MQITSINNKKKKKKFKDKFPTLKEKPFFELILTLVLLLLALIVGLTSIYLQESNMANFGLQLGLFFAWYLGIVVVALLINLFILFHKKNPKSKNRK